MTPSNYLIGVIIIKYMHFTPKFHCSSLPLFFSAFALWSSSGCLSVSLFNKEHLQYYFECLFMQGALRVWSRWRASAIWKTMHFFIFFPRQNASELPTSLFNLDLFNSKSLLFRKQRVDPVHLKHLRQLWAAMATKKDKE